MKAYRNDRHTIRNTSNVWMDLEQLREVVYQADALGLKDSSAVHFEGLTKSEVFVGMWHAKTVQVSSDNLTEVTGYYPPRATDIDIRNRPHDEAKQ